MQLSSWMSWEDGISVVARTDPDLPMPNLILFLARMVHTPVGSAPAGLVFYQPGSLPLVTGFISPVHAVAAWIGPNIYGDTNFEHALALGAEIGVEQPDGNSISAHCMVAGHRFDLQLGGLGEMRVFQRKASEVTPFHKQGLEAAAGLVGFQLDGAPVELTLPESGLTGGPAAGWTPAGIYSR